MDVSLEEGTPLVRGRGRKVRGGGRPTQRKPAISGGPSPWLPSPGRNGGDEEGTLLVLGRGPGVRSSEASRKV